MINTLYDLFRISLCLNSNFVFFFYFPFLDDLKNIHQEQKCRLTA